MFPAVAQHDCREPQTAWPPSLDFELGEDYFQHGGFPKIRNFSINSHFRISFNCTCWRCRLLQLCWVRSFGSWPPDGCRRLLPVGLHAGGYQMLMQIQPVRLIKQLALSRNGCLRRKILAVARIQKLLVATTDTLAVRRVLLVSICLDHHGGAL